MGIGLFFGSFLKLCLALSLLACTGASLDGPAGEVGGPLGGLGQTNQAEGTLSSQSSYQEMSGGCGNDTSLRFPGEGSDFNSYLMRDTDPDYFPKVTLGKAEGDTFLPCIQCQGRLLRIIDLGEAPGWTNGTLQKHRTKMVGWMISLASDTWDPELLPNARYRDFLIGAGGEVDLTGLETKSNHLYYFILSKSPGMPVTNYTAFQSIEELNGMFSCPMNAKAADASAPFHPLRLIHALDKKPMELNPEVGPLQPSGEQEENPEPDTGLHFDLQNVTNHLENLK